MGEIRPKTCEGVGITWSLAATAFAAQASALGAVPRYFNTPLEAPAVAAPPVLSSIGQDVNLVCGSKAQPARMKGEATIPCLL